MESFKVFNSKEKKQDLCSLKDVKKLIEQKKGTKKDCKGVCCLSLQNPHIPCNAEDVKNQPQDPHEWLEKYATLHFGTNSKLKYKDEGVREGKTCAMMLHRGQRKLFLAELRFLLTYAKPNDRIVYVGSAPGLHTYVLHKLFAPLNLKWELWDPNPFSKTLLKFPEYFTIKQKYMNDEEIKKWKTTHKNWGTDFLLISDIRATDNLTGREHDEQLLKDNKLQEDMVRKWRPRVSMLKFRFPYPPSNTIKYESSYLDGTVWFQSFANQKSTEGRLIVERPDGRWAFPSRIYNWTEWEEYFFYQNAVKRRLNFGCEKEYSKIYDGCFDCQSEIRLWDLYVSQYHSENNKYKIIKKLAKKLNKHIGTLQNTGIWCSLIKDNTICINLIDTKTVKDKATKDKTTKEKTTKEKATKDKATKDKATKDKATKDKTTKEKATKEKATKEKATKEKATKEKATKEKATKEKAAKEKTTKGKTIKGKTTKGKATKEKATKEKATKGKATKEKVLKEKDYSKSKLKK